jgi:glycosyltransferase involved in cell wall biosynthesis
VHPLEKLYPQLKNSEPSSLQMDSFLAHMDLMQSYLVFCFGLQAEKKMSFYHLGEMHFYSNQVYLSDRYDSLDIIKKSLFSAQDYFQKGYASYERNNSDFYLLEDEIVGFELTCNYYIVLFDFLIGDRAKSVEMARSELDKNKDLMHEDLKSIYKYIIEHDLNCSPFEILSAFYRGDFKNIFFKTIKLSQYQLDEDDFSRSIKLKMDLLFYTEEYGFNYQQVTWRSSLLKHLYASEYPESEKVNVLSLIQNDHSFKDSCLKSQLNYFELNQTLPESIDILVDWQCQDLNRLTSSLRMVKDGGLCLIAVPRSCTNPEVIRKEMEIGIQASCFLIDRESFSDILIVYGFKNRKFNLHTRLLILMRPDSVQAMGGADIQLFKSRARLKHAGICSDISLACRLDSRVYACIYVVGYYHEIYKFNYLNQSNLPKLCMPIASLCFEESQVSDYFIGMFKHDLQEKITSNHKNLLCIENINFLRQSILNKLALDSNWNNRFYKELAKSCDYFIPQSQKEMDLLFPQRDYKEFELVFNGCNFAGVVEEKSNIFVDTHKINDYIICVGRIQANKNQLFLAYALRETEIPLVLIGREFQQGYLKLCQDLGNNQVYHFEDVSSDMLLSALQNARLFVLPSFSEVSPLSSIEAAMIGVPVVLTQNSGQDEQFKDAFYYCDPWDPENIKEVIVKAFYADNSDKIKRAKEIAEKTSSWSIMSDKIANIIYMLIGRENGDNYIQYQDKWFKLLPALAEQDKSVDIAHSAYQPSIYPIANVGTFLAQQYDPLIYKDVFLIVNTDLAEFKMKQLGFENTIKQIPSPNQSTYLGGVSLALEDACQRNLLCFYDPENIFSWQETILAYIEGHSPEDNCVLFICTYDCDDSHYPEEEISDYLISQGCDLESIPNISILTDFKAQKQLKDLFKSVDILVFPAKTLWGYESLYYQIIYSEKTVITHPFNRGIHTQKIIYLEPFESLCQLPSFAEIPVSVQTLSQCLKLADPSR